MPNDYQIYLHDTPAKALFEHTRRDASHGCIRLSDPLGLARFLLRDRISTGPRPGSARRRAPVCPTTVRLRQRVPVMITYATAVARSNGDVFFYQDIYGHDRALTGCCRPPLPRVDGPHPAWLVVLLPTGYY